MPPGRPGQLTAAAILLGAAWAIMAVLLAWMTSNAHEAAEVISKIESSNTELGREPEIGRRYGVYWGLLLLALCVLLWAIPRALGGHQAGRVILWLMAALLALEPLRICVVAIADGTAEVTMVFIAFIGIGASGVAAVLMTLPPVNAYTRAIQMNRLNQRG